MLAFRYVFDSMNNVLNTEEVILSEAYCDGVIVNFLNIVLTNN
jgi:hypothetical protein